jgi:hypothetical protein
MAAAVPCGGHFLEAAEALIRNSDAYDCGCDAAGVAVS